MRYVPKGRAGRILFFVVAGGLGLLVLAQAVPYGRSHTNPPVTGEPAWYSPQTRALAARACFDCHSNLTTWPWYSNIAPNSWLIQGDADGGRSTERDKPQEVDLGELADSINGGGMPPWYYTLLHSKSKLSKAVKQQLVDGLAKTLRSSPSGARAG